MSADVPQHDIEDWVVERKMSELTDKDVHVLVKQAYVNDEGQVNPQRTHLFVYALDKKTHVPIHRDQLKTILEQSRSALDTELPKLAVTLPAVDSTGRISMLELALILICVILLLLAFCMLFYIAKYCKRRIKGELSGEYMVDSQTAGPRPYDVEQIDRKTAQTILSSRPLPDPYEESKTYDKKLNGSSAQNPVDNHDGLQYANRTLNVPLKARQLSDAYGKIGPRSRNFSGDVMQVHTLVNEMDSTLSSTLKATKEGVLFPVYRTQGYDS
ncbi:unnamed protein product [Anisakis simplex]|uniref:Uncharacterized protein n=1 Tax=Anisakis simplex TaxID=6269 RepID=A0A3P6RE49_ANISI|nr:unnamed protein product [Anisakis simplex]